jgi:4-hydroxy-tetrahydrodipicolinate reductase
MKIALLGYGKMGRMIEDIGHKSSLHEIVLKINSSNRQALTKEQLSDCEVAIDFSTPASVIANIQLCLEAGVPMVIGSTGWYDHLEEVKKLCEEKQGAIIYASNFNIGVNILFELNKKLAILMKSRSEYIPAVTEIHHKEKKDMPSGTAISLAKDILKESALKKSWVNFSPGNSFEQTANSPELIILSQREDNVIGIHNVEYISPADKIEIRHEAFSREGFASGGLLAAEWIVKRKGFYEFREILFSS